MGTQTGSLITIAQIYWSLWRDNDTQNKTKPILLFSNWYLHWQYEIHIVFVYGSIRKVYCTRISRSGRIHQRRSRDYNSYIAPKYRSCTLPHHHLFFVLILTQLLESQLSILFLSATTLKRLISVVNKLTRHDNRILVGSMLIYASTPLLIVHFKDLNVSCNKI